MKLYLFVLAGFAEFSFVTMGLLSGLSGHYARGAFLTSVACYLAILAVSIRQVRASHLLLVIRGAEDASKTAAST